LPSSISHSAKFHVIDIYSIDAADSWTLVAW